MNKKHKEVLKILLYIAFILIILIISQGTNLGAKFMAITVLSVFFYVLRLIEIGLRIVNKRVSWRKIKKLNLRKVCRERGREGMEEVLKRDKDRQENDIEIMVIIMAAILILGVIVLGISSS